MNEAQTSRKAPSERTLLRIGEFVEKYREKSGTSAHPNPDVSQAKRQDFVRSIHDLE